MGIKFHCPNGHKLNVKAFLAGKKGVCPKCGTGVRIPLTSEAGLESDLEEHHAAGGNGSARGGLAAAASSAAAAASAAVAQGSHGPANGAGTLLAAPPPAPPTSAGGGAGDPISEAPAAIWYVRPPAGGQYGPARGDVMRSWLTEGRISGDSHVWREGWTDWRTAGDVFQGLQAPTPAAAPVIQVLAPAGPSKPALVQPVPPRGTGVSGLAVAVLVGLALLIVVSGGALAYIVFFLK